MAFVEKYNLAYTGEHLENAARVLKRIADTYEMLAARRQEYNPAADSVIIQLKEVARLILEYTGAYSRETELLEEDQKEMESAFEKRGVSVKDIKVIERGDGRREIRMYLRAVKKKCPTTREIAGILSEALHSLFDSTDNNRIMLNGNFNEYVFLECGRFNAMHGIAKRNKAGNTISGDTFSINEISCGKILIGLADGMGSGYEANAESNLVIELLEEAVRAGFSEAAAIEMINTAMAVNDVAGTPVTMDMCVLDTFLGIANFIKLGAVATYIKRDGWIEIIQSETLPMGVLNKVDFDYTVKKLYADDYIIMVSDGVLEAIPELDKEEAFLGILSGVRSQNPERMAEEILDTVMALSPDWEENLPKDDMTVIVTGLFERS